MGLPQKNQGKAQPLLPGATGNTAFLQRSPSAGILLPCLPGCQCSVCGWVLPDALQEKGELPEPPQGPPGTACSWPGHFGPGPEFSPVPCRPVNVGHKLSQTLNSTARGQRGSNRPCPDWARATASSEQLLQGSTEGGNEERRYSPGLSAPALGELANQENDRLVGQSPAQRAGRAVLECRVATMPPCWLPP